MTEAAKLVDRIGVQLQQVKALAKFGGGTIRLLAQFLVSRPGAGSRPG
jgi:hypothetical protein